MMITKMALPRRTFLKGLGTAVALPLLDSMVPALTAQAATVANTPRRLGYVFIPMGMNPAPWTPKEMGALTSLSPSLAALTPHLDNVTVVTNMALENAHTTGFRDFHDNVAAMRKCDEWKFNAEHVANSRFHYWLPLLKLPVVNVQREHSLIPIQ